jgi:hypothetical protein
MKGTGGVDISDFVNEPHGTVFNAGTIIGHVSFHDGVSAFAARRAEVELGQMRRGATVD